MWDTPEEPVADRAAEAPEAPGPTPDDVICPQCRGKGRMPEQGDLSGGTCGVCRGRGLVRGEAGVLPAGAGVPVAGAVAGAGVPGGALPANSYQHGGDHYKQPDGGEEHWDRVWRLWGPGYFVGNITKYAERCMLKDGVGALKKCGHYVAKLIELLESGVPPGHMGRAGGAAITAEQADAVVRTMMSELRAAGPRDAAAGACTCGADRTGPSAEAHDSGCPAAGPVCGGEDIVVPGVGHPY
jgi:hypothetical protein